MLFDVAATPVFTSTPGVAEAVVRGHEKTFFARDLSISTRESNSISFCRTSRDLNL